MNTAPNLPPQVRDLTAKIGGYGKENLEDILHVMM